MSVEMSVIDVFACVGGNALGLEAVGFAMRHFIEDDPFRRRVLRRNYPDVPISDDIREYHGRRGQFDVVIGFPPCSTTSVGAAVHGKRTGVTLWPDMRRIVDEVGPSWVITEHPVGVGYWEAQVQRDLADLGYHTSRLELSAEELGAPHIRRRVYLLAHHNRERLQVARESKQRAVEGFARGTLGRNPWDGDIPGTLRVDAGVPHRVDRRARIRAMGQSNPPIMTSVIGYCIQMAEAPRP